eukprot:4603014-Amphidinium_carterae.1
MVALLPGSDGRGDVLARAASSPSERQGQCQHCRGVVACSLAESLAVRAIFTMKCACMVHDAVAPRSCNKLIRLLQEPHQLILCYSFFLSCQGCGYCA